MTAGGEGLFVVETFTPKGALAVVPHQFPTTTVTLSPGQESHIGLTVPRLAGMDELVVERASLTLKGEQLDLPAVVRKSLAAANTQQLVLPSGSAGALRRVRIEGLFLEPDANLPGDAEGAFLESTQGTVGQICWSFAGGKATFQGTQGSPSKALHVLFFPLVKPATYGTPAAAAPRFDQPNPPPGQHTPLLGGTRMTLDNPSAGAKTGSLTIELDPPLAVPDVRISIVVSEKSARKASPFDSYRIKWGAATVTGTWATAPQKAELSIATSAGGPATTLAGPEGELVRPLGIDFTPSAHAMLNELYQKGGAGDLQLALTARAASIGSLKVQAPSMSVRYRRKPAGGEGLPVQLRGSPAPVQLAVPSGLRPGSFTLTLDGRFGRSMLVTAADTGLTHPRRGWQLSGPIWLARRLALTGAERALPLSRVSLFGRATGETELLVSFHDGDERHIGARRGKPVALEVAASSAPDWCRAEMAEGVVPVPHPEALWVVVLASRGVFFWYGDPTGPGPAQSSADEGASWSDVDGGPALQLHVATAPETAPLSVWRADQTRIVEDVLSASVPSERSRVQLSRLQAARLGLLAGAVKADASSFATFRKEGLALLAPDEVRAAGGQISLVFASVRDADFRILAAELLYDPWSAKGG